MAPGPTETGIADSPFALALAAQIAQLYDLIATPRVFRQLHVCECNVCMTPEQRAAIVATPMRDMPIELIREYSNSAHGIMGDADDIRAFLPRYLEWMWRDVAVDYNQVGCELHRFGEAIWADAAFLTAAQSRAYNDCAALMIRHFGRREAAGEAHVANPFHLIDVFVTGGVRVDGVTGAMEDLFDGPLGDKALLLFCQSVTSQMIQRRMSYGVDMFGVGYAPVQARRDLAAWLRSARMQLRIETLFMRDDLDEAALLHLDQAMTVFPNIDGDAFPDHARRHARRD